MLPQKMNNEDQKALDALVDIQIEEGLHPDLLDNELDEEDE